MAVELGEDTQKQLMETLARIEEKTDLQDLSVINRAGMRLASAKTCEMDADANTASASALIDLGGKMASSMDHGDLREILLRNEAGYNLLMAISEDLMIIGTLNNPLRVGYYLGYLRNLCVELANVVLGELSPEAIEFFKRQQAEEADLATLASEIEFSKPTAEQDMAAMQDVMSFLDDWGGAEDLAPEPITAGGGGAAVATEAVSSGAMAEPAAAEPAAAEAGGGNLAGNLEAALEGLDALDLFDTGVEASSAAAATPASTTEPTAETAPAGTSGAASTMDTTAPAESEAPAIELDELDKFTIADESSDAIGAAETDYGIPLYEGEVPPVPLEDVTTAIGYGESEYAQVADAGQTGVSPDQMEAQQPQPDTFAADQAVQASAEPASAEPASAPIEEPGGPAPSPAPTLAPPPEAPQFELVDEYDEVDLELDESDAMAEALDALGWMEEEEDA